jgi:hypothetical protein
MLVTRQNGKKHASSTHNMLVTRQNGKKHASNTHNMLVTRQEWQETRVPARVERHDVTRDALIALDVTYVADDEDQVEAR